MKVELIKTPAGSVCCAGTEEELDGFKQSIGAFRYEPFATDVFDHVDYQRFIDGGAAFGYFSHYVSHNKPYVSIEAFEPEPLRFACLEYTTGNFARHNLALASPHCEPLPKRSPGLMMAARLSLGQEAHDCAWSATTKLSSVLSVNVPTLVKLDIEGGEFSLLANTASRYLMRPDITWLVEIHEFGKHKKEEIFKFFDGRKFTHIHSGPLGNNHTYLIQ